MSELKLVRGDRMPTDLAQISDEDPLIDQIPNMTKNLLEQMDFYVQRREMSPSEAWLEATKPPTQEYIERIKSKPLDKISSLELSQLARIDPQGAQLLLRAMGSEARRQLESGASFLQFYSQVKLHPFLTERLKALRLSMIESLGARPGFEIRLAEMVALEFHLYEQWAAVEVLHLECELGSC